LRSIRSLSLRSLAAASLWSHRVALAAWSAGVGVVMVVFAYSFRGMVADFEGGAAGFAAAAQVTADAMRPLSGPAFGLDTYAGYVTYHNVGIWSLLLAVYAAIQGAQALRGLEERGMLQLYISTSSRARVFASRVGTFIALMALVAAGTGIGMALGLVAGGEGAAEISLTACVFYGLALLVSQLTAASRTAAGAVSLFAAASYVFSNLYAQLGPLAWLRFASPFYYLLESKFVMVNGHHAALLPTIALAVGTAALVAAAWPLFAHRDLEAAAIRAPFATRRRREWRLRARRASVRSLWTVFVRDQRLSLAAWAGGVFILLVAYLNVFPQVRTIWETSDIVKALISTAGGSTLLAGYLSFTLSFVAIVASAYSVVEAGRWLGDRAAGRDEMYLAGSPVSRTRLQLERWVALVAGNAVISLTAVAGLLVGTISIGESIDAWGAVRSAADVVLIGVAVGGLSAVLATWLRSGVALGALGAVLAASYLLTMLRPLFKWPEWTAHLSVFDAFGYPYTGVPAPLGLAVLTVLAVGGAIVAALIAVRRSAA
jgi:ABC-2 type transport system permease protein